MCTQNGHAANRHRSGHVNRRHQHNTNEKYFSKRVSGSSKSGDSNNSYLNSACYNSSSCGKVIETTCLIAKQSVSAVKCKHIICLLLGYFAMSSAEVANTVGGNSHSGHIQPTALMLNLTRPRNVSTPDEKNSTIPSPESHSVHEDEQNRLMYSSTPQPEKDMFTGPEVYGINKNTQAHTEHWKHDRLHDESTTTADEESKYFILNLFHRYSTNDYLLRTDLDKLVRNIRLSPHAALNSSEDSIIDDEAENFDGHEHGKNDSSHHNDELKQHTSAELVRNGGLVLGNTDPDYHNPYNATTIHDSYPTSVDSHQNQFPTGHTQDATSLPSGASSRSDRQIRQLSHQHGEHNQCLSTAEILQLFRYDQLTRLNVEHFLHVCPVLIDQLDAGFCKQQSVSKTTDHGQSQSGKDSSIDHQHNHSEDYDHHNHGNGHDDDESKQDTHEHVDTDSVPPAVWIYALLSVAVISLCSVAGVVVIPNMKRVFYNHILQFLVALAVGAMSGDTMLHLLPHAMLSGTHHHNHHQHAGADVTTIPHNHDEDSDESSSHMKGLYKGLVALLGIYSFFFLERLFTMFTRNRSGRSERKQKPRRRCHEKHTMRNQAFHMVNSRLENDGGNTPSCEEMVMVVHPNKALRAYADVSHEAYLHRCDESLVQPPLSHTPRTIQPQQRDIRKEDAITMEGIATTGLSIRSVAREPAVMSDAEIVGITKDAEVVQSTHSHSHSHLAPDFVGPLSSVAMMIIVGDMIHNFCDGLAIGAAYAGNVAGGLSTSMAVFCHELPHEIGDFAVLVRSGLTMRKAVCFNLISSIPCFIGVLIGLAVGNVTSTTAWIFAGVGGMFLYVTLVDLIPEMSSVYTKSGEPWFLHLLLQASGIAVGTTIMLVISIYEESLLTVFN